MKKRLSLAATVLAALFSSTASAAVIINNSQNVAPDGGAVHESYDPSVAGSPDLLSASSTDLIQGLLPSIVYTGGTGTTTFESCGGEANWTNGSLTTVYAQGGSGGDDVDHATYGSVTATVGGYDVDTFVTYDLGALYNVSQVDVFMGWNDSGRDDSSFNLLVSRYGDTFTQIAAYDKGGDNTGSIGTPITNLHSVVDDGGASIGKSVQYVQLQFTDADNGTAGMVEVDVFGAAVPEPSTVALLALAGVAGLFVRRK